MEKHIIGAYDSTNEAAAVIEQLSNKGYSPEEIVVVSNREQVNSLENRTGLSVERTGAGQNDSGSMWDKIKDAFTLDEEEHSKGRLSKFDISDEDARRYESKLDDGKILIAVESDSRNVLDDGFATKSDRTMDSGANITSAREERFANSNEEKSMELHEERLNVDKNEVKTGEVSVGKDVVEEERSVDVPVRHEEVYVEKRHVEDGETRNTSPEIGEDDEIRIPVVEEKVEVQKKPVVTDEVVIGKRTTEETEHVSDTVKKEEVHVDKEGSTSIKGEDTLNTADNRQDTAGIAGYQTGREGNQEGLENTWDENSDKAKRDFKNTKNLDDERYKGKDYRGDF